MSKWSSVCQFTSHEFLSKRRKKRRVTRKKRRKETKEGLKQYRNENRLYKEFINYCEINETKQEKVKGNMSLHQQRLIYHRPLMVERTVHLDAFQ